MNTKTIRRRAYHSNNVYKYELHTIDAPTNPLTIATNVDDITTFPAPFPGATVGTPGGGDAICTSYGTADIVWTSVNACGPSPNTIVHTACPSLISQSPRELPVGLFSVMCMSVGPATIVAAGAKTRTRFVDVRT